MTCKVNDIVFDKKFLEHISDFFKNLFYVDNCCQEIDLSPDNNFVKDFVKILEFYQRNIDDIHAQFIKLSKYDLYFSDWLKEDESNFNIFNNRFFDFKNRVLKILEIDSQTRCEIFKNKQKNTSVCKESGLLHVLNSSDKFYTVTEEHFFVKNMLELSHKYMVTFLLKECEKWLCDNNNYLIDIYNIVNEIEWAYVYNLYTYIDFLIDSSKNSLYISQKILNRNKVMFKTLFDKHVLENINLISKSGYITVEDYDPIPFITKDWCSVPEEYEKFSSSNNIIVYKYDSNKYFILKDNNKYAWLTL